MAYLRNVALWIAVVLPLCAQNPSGGGRGGRGGGGGAGRGYPAYDQAAVERGQKQFVSACGFCHGPGGKGGEGGPDLLRSEIVLDDDNGEKIGPVILNGRPDKGMPKFPLTPAQISDIRVFLHLRIKDAALRGTYKILDIVTGDPKAGAAYFNGAGKCNTCHSPAGDLKGVASKYDPVALQGKFLMPRGGRGGAFANPEQGNAAIIVTVTLASGQSFQGKLERIDDFNVALTDRAGEYHSFARNGDTPKVELKDPLQAHYDLLRKYTDTDMHNLTAYLVTLK
jgi:cytochrome c oxidase cbb3-type subunit 3